MQHTARTDTCSPDLNRVEGEFAGWRTWNDDTFEMHSGPFWHRKEPDGTIRCAFRVQKKHLNSSSNVHGGLTFADYCLFAIAAPVLQGAGVTVEFGCQCLDAGREGDLILGTGEVTRAGGSLIFVRGQLTVGERTLFTFFGTIKRRRQKTIT